MSKWLPATNLTDTNRVWSRPSLLLPRREGGREGALAGGAFLDRQDGAAAVVVDHRHVEPGPLLEELEIALHLRIERGEADQQETVGALHGEARERHAARLLGLLHQDARDVLDAAMREVRRQREHDLDRVARRQRLVEIAPQRPFH